MPATRSSKRRKTGGAVPDADPLPANKDTSQELSAENFTYKSLDPQKSEIRLLRILPARKFDGVTCGVECEIFHAQLTEDLDYVALSYVWGEKLDLQSVTIQGYPFSVTGNLYAALLELRALKRDRPIWIDAVCINQDDNNERSDQVRKMGKIFSFATEVIAWLGTADEDSERAIALIHILKVGIEDREMTRNIIREPRYLDHFFGLYKLFFRDYFWRVWVIQEVALATSSITILCGADTLSWSDLVKVQETLAEHHLLDIDDIAHEREELSFLRVTVDSRGPRALLLPSTAGPIPDLSQILLKHRFKESTDPKDKVYSLVGLSDARDNPRFVLDYSRSVREVYIDLVNYVVSTAKRLDIICAMPRWKSPHDLPSWTPDWSFAALGSSLLNEYFEHQYSAAGQSQADATISGDGILSARGISLDIVSHVGRGSEMADLEDEKNALSVLFDWYKMFIPAMGDKEVAQAAFIRTMLRDKMEQIDYDGWDKSDFLRVILGAFIKAADSTCPGLKMDSDLIELSRQRFPEVVVGRLMKESREMIYGRRFIMTESNIPGLVPETTIKGDLVCIFLGCQLPVILREEKDHYVFLGEAYIDGYMNGFAMEELKAGKHRERQFEIH